MGFGLPEAVRDSLDGAADETCSVDYDEVGRYLAQNSDRKNLILNALTLLAYCPEESPPLLAAIRAEDAPLADALQAEAGG